MKFCKTKLWAFALAIFATMSMMSCDDKTKKDPMPEPPIPDPENAVVLPQATAIYVGDDNEAGTGHVLLALYSEGVTMDKDTWEFTGDGQAMWIDMNTVLAADASKPQISSGTYVAETFGASFAEFTFGILAEGGELGSFHATVAGGKETADWMTGGTVRVSQTDGKYKVIVEGKAKSGKELVYKFEGVLPFVVFGVPIAPGEFEGEFTNAQAGYFADYYKAGYGNVMLTLTDEGVYQYGFHELGLDLNVPIFTSQNDINIPVGTYRKAAVGEYNKPFTFNIGQNEGEGIAGSYWLDLTSEGSFDAKYRVENGTCVVSQNGDKYEITVSLTLDDGTLRQGTFTGKVKLVDESCLSRMEGDVTLNNFTQGMMVYRGENIEYFSNNSANWAVALGTDGVNLVDMTGTGDAIQLDINTPTKDSMALPVGEFVVIKNMTTEALIPWTFNPGHYSSNAQMYRATWYRQGEGLNFTAPGVAGTIKIAKQDDQYTVSFDLKDDYYYLPNKNSIKGSYTGSLKYIDARPKENGAPKSLAPRSNQEKRASRFAR